MSFLSFFLSFSMKTRQLILFPLFFSPKPPGSGPDPEALAVLRRAVSAFEMYHRIVQDVNASMIDRFDAEVAVSAVREEVEAMFGGFNGSANNSLIDQQTQMQNAQEEETRVKCNICLEVSHGVSVRLIFGFL